MQLVSGLLVAGVVLVYLGIAVASEAKRWRKSRASEKGYIPLSENEEQTVPLQYANV